MILTDIEKEFQKTTHWIKRTNNYIEKDSFINWLLIRPIQDTGCCVVGDVRSKLGLSRDYNKDDKESCDRCSYLGMRFMEDILFRNRERFDNHLIEFKTHLKDIHKKELK